MSKNNQLPSAEQIMSTPAAQSQLLLAPPATPEIAALQARYLQMQIAALERQNGAFQEQEEIKKAAQKQGALDMQRRREREIAIQTACPHLKPNYTSAIGGQKDHGNHYHWICAYCAKEWTDNELPIHLRVSMDRVGGPQ